MARKKKRAMRVGQSRITMRKVGGRRRKVRVTKKSGGRYSVRVVGKRRRRK